MPRIPNREVEDDFDDYDDEFSVDQDDPRDRMGRRLPRQERNWEEQRREQWRKRNRDDY